jgi:hypothetical protein
MPTCKKAPNPLQKSNMTAFLLELNAWQLATSWHNSQPEWHTFCHAYALHKGCVITHPKTGERIYPKTAKAFPIRDGNDPRQLSLGLN